LSGVQYATVRSAEGASPQAVSLSLIPYAHTDTVPYSLSAVFEMSSAESSVTTRKRARTTQTAVVTTATADAPAKTKRARVKAKLEMMSNLPLDCIYEVCICDLLISAAAHALSHDTPDLALPPSPRPFALGAHLPLLALSSHQSVFATDLGSGSHICHESSPGMPRPPQRNSVQQTAIRHSLHGQ
jgi:hypothetical protein